jgi:hypothetical protein
MMGFCCASREIPSFRKFVVVGRIRSISISRDAFEPTAKGSAKDRLFCSWDGGVARQRRSAPSNESHLAQAPGADRAAAKSDRPGGTKLKIARHRVCRIASGLTFTASLGLLLGPMLGSGQGARTLGFLCLGLFAMGWLFGPMEALVPELFPTRVRYTGASVTYNLKGILGASARPYLAQRLSEWGGIGWVGLYLDVVAGVSFGAVWLMPETSKDLLR